ncbi:hypothetical protein D3C87_48980 [compost metagenome]
MHKFSTSNNFRLNVALRFVLILLTLNNLSCKRDELESENETNLKYFFYMGNDEDIKAIIEDFKQLDKKKSFTSAYPVNDKISWDHAYRLYTLKKSDSVKYKVPIIEVGGVVRNFITISKRKNERIQAPALHVFDVEFLDNLNIEQRAFIANSLNCFSARGLKVPKEVLDFTENFNEFNRNLIRSTEARMANQIDDSNKGNFQRLNDHGNNSVATSSTNSCFVSLDFEWSFYRTDNCPSIADANASIINTIITYLDQRLAGVPQVEKIEYNPFSGIIITGEAGYISNNKSYFMSLVEQSKYIYFHCAVGGSLYFTRNTVSDNCQNSPGGGGGSSPNNVIVDQTVVNNVKLSCVMGKILNTANSGYVKLLQGFINSSTYNVTFKVEPVIPTQTGTANGSTVQPIGTKNVIIYLKTSFVEQNSVANIAKTVVHEMAHAYLAQKLLTIGGAGNLAQNMNNKEFKDLFAYYSKYVNPATGAFSAVANNDFDHAAMAGLLINDIAGGIKDFIESNYPAVKTDEYVSFDNYKALAWIGLRDTEAYDKFKSLTGETNESQTLKITVLESSSTYDCN